MIRGAKPSWSHFRTIWALTLGAFVLCAPTALSSARQPVRSLAEIRYDRIVMQKWDLSCGAAALATLLTFDLNDPVGEREVATAMLHRTDPIKVRTRGGFSLLDLQQYAETRGYEASGYGQMTIEDLAGMLPAIVPIRVHGFDHFVVARMVSSDKVWFADSAFGNRSLARATFDRA